MFSEQRLVSFVARMRGLDIPIRIRLWNDRQFDLGETPKVTLRVSGAPALRHLLRPTLDSLGHAYVEGGIDLEGDVADIIDVGARLAANAGGNGDWRPPARWRRHTRALDAEAIASHYDVSNEFYAQWLDEGMVYSCAYFRQPTDSLEAAQRAKIDHILRKLKLRPGDRFLDIGCGWGSLAMAAARDYGAQALGVTLSRNQYELARERIRAAGLADRCQVRLQDYRDVDGQFDRIASVGMFEHVGLRHLGEYFRRMRDLLADDGVALNHGITSGDPDSGETPFGGGDFIDRYVFPHGELPHVSLVLREMAAAGLEATDVENLRRHYAVTLEHWSRRYENAAERIRALVGEQRFRTWRVYLAGCAYAFAHRWIALHQVLAVKDNGRDPLPMTRDYIYR
jgi:cyclopropane-fatty-acyl-phospholipid synthase